MTPVISQADTLKIVNLQLKLKTLSLSKKERQRQKNSSRPCSKAARPTSR